MAFARDYRASDDGGTVAPHFFAKQKSSFANSFAMGLKFVLGSTTFQLASEPQWCRGGAPRAKPPFVKIQIDF